MNNSTLSSVIILICSMALVLGGIVAMAVAWGP